MAELAVALDLRRRGYRVSFPYGEDSDYDLIVDRLGSLERVQVKYTRSDGHVIEIECRSHSLTKGKVKATKHYTAAMIEWIAAYDVTSDRCYYVPAALLGEGRTMLSLRLTPPRNNQLLRIRRAEEFTTI